MTASTPTDNPGSTSPGSADNQGSTDSTDIVVNAEGEPVERARELRRSTVKIAAVNGFAGGVLMGAHHQSSTAASWVALLVAAALVAASTIWACRRVVPTQARPELPGRPVATLVLGAVVPQSVWLIAVFVLTIASA